MPKNNVSKMSRVFFCVKVVTKKRREAEEEEEEEEEDKKKCRRTHHHHHHHPIPIPIPPPPTKKKSGSPRTEEERRRGGRYTARLKKPGVPPRRRFEERFAFYVKVASSSMIRFRARSFALSSFLFVAAYFFSSQKALSLCVSLCARSF